MKTKEELNNLKQEFETLNKKLRELTEDELKMVIGGSWQKDGPSDCTFFELGHNGQEWCTAPTGYKGKLEWCSSCNGKRKVMETE